MIGFGAYGPGGSSSSSSNLSASAPPFTVDRSIPKSKSNTLVPLHEPPPYVSASPFFHNSTTKPNSFTNPDLKVESFGPPYLPPTNNYQYLGSFSLNSPSTQVHPSNPDSISPSDGFDFQYSIEKPLNGVVEAKPFYSQYDVPVVDDDTPLVALNEPNVDLLSNSCIGPPMGVPLHDDFTRTSSGLGYTPQWCSFWNGVADGKQARQVHEDGSYRTEETDIESSYFHKDYMKLGDCTGSSKREDTFGVSHKKLVGGQGRESQILFPCTGMDNNRTLSEQNYRFIFGEPTGGPIPGMSSTFERSHTHLPQQESTANSWTSLKQCGAPYDQCVKPLKSMTKDNATYKKSPPPSVIRPQSSGSNFTTPNVASAENMNSVGYNAFVCSKDFGGHDPTYEKEPQLQQNYDSNEGYLVTGRPSFHTERGDHVFATSSLTRREELSNKSVVKDVLDHLSKVGMEHGIPNINVPKGNTLVLGGMNVVTENSAAGFDYYNPAVDSPCWKGAPASHFPSSEVSEALNPQHLKKKLESCDFLDIQGADFFSPCIVDTVKFSCENSGNNQNGYVELGSLLSTDRVSEPKCPAEEQSSNEDDKAGLDSPEMNSIKGQYSSDIHSTRKECKFIKDLNSEADSKSSIKELSAEIRHFMSKGEFDLNSGVEDGGMDNNDTSGVDSTPSHVSDNVSYLSSVKVAENVGKMHSTESMPKTNVQLLVNTICNLSELLLFQVSTDASAVSEQDYEALRCVIKNLDACVSKKTTHLIPKQELILHNEGTQEHGELQNLHKDITVGRHEVSKGADVTFDSQSDQQQGRCEAKLHTVSDKDFERCLDGILLGGYTDSMKNDNMVLVCGLKEVLSKNFNCEEEMQPQTVLYKNLWLEAESALCAMNLKARFNRMKIEMEKCRSPQRKDVAENSKAVEEAPSLDIAAEGNVIGDVSSLANDTRVLDKSIQDSPISCADNVDDDVEASVMARFQILKFRSENSNLGNAERQQTVELTDSGFTGTRSCWAANGGKTEDGTLGTASGTHSQHHAASNGVGKFGSYADCPEHETVKELGVLCNPGDQVGQCYGSNRLNLLASGWHESLSSDWEHVLKDELA